MQCVRRPVPPQPRDISSDITADIWRNRMVSGQGLPPWSIVDKKRWQSLVKDAFLRRPFFTLLFLHHFFFHSLTSACAVPQKVWIVWDRCVCVRVCVCVHACVKEDDWCWSGSRDLCVCVCVRRGRKRRGGVGGVSGWHKAPRVRQPCWVSLHRSAATPCCSHDKPRPDSRLMGRVTHTHTSPLHGSHGLGRRAIRSSMNAAAAVTLTISRSLLRAENLSSQPNQVLWALSCVFVNRSWGSLLSDCDVAECQECAGASRAVVLLLLPLSHWHTDTVPKTWLLMSCICNESFTMAFVKTPASLERNQCLINVGRVSVDTSV